MHIETLVGGRRDKVALWWTESEEERQNGGSSENHQIWIQRLITHPPLFTMSMDMKNTLMRTSCDLFDLSHDLTCLSNSNDLTCLIFITVTWDLLDT